MAPSLPDHLVALLGDLPPEELSFTPVPLKARRDGWTPERQIEFILALAGGASVATAAAGVGRSRQSAYALRARSGGESFAAAWDVAISLHAPPPPDLADFHRVLQGVPVPVVYRGRIVGYRRVHDDRALTGLLRGLYAARQASAPRQRRQNV